MLFNINQRSVTTTFSWSTKIRYSPSPIGYHCYSLTVYFISYPQMANLWVIPCPRTWFAFFYLFSGCGFAFSFPPFSFVSLFLVMRYLGCWFFENIFQFATQRKRGWGIWDFNLFQLSLFLSSSAGPLGRNKSILLENFKFMHWKRKHFLALLNVFLVFFYMHSFTHKHLCVIKIDTYSICTIRQFWGPPWHPLVLVANGRG